MTKYVVVFYLRTGVKNLHGPFDTYAKANEYRRVVKEQHPIICSAEIEEIQTVTDK